MKPINLLGAATALAMAATPAYAANWVYVGADVNNAVRSFDADTIRRSGNQVTFWEKRDHSRDQTVKYREQQTRYRIDCWERTHKLLNAIEYYPDGRTESFDFSGASEQKAHVVVPETIMEAMLEAVCEATAP